MSSKKPAKAERAPRDNRRIIRGFQLLTDGRFVTYAGDTPAELDALEERMTPEECEYFKGQGWIEGDWSPTGKPDRADLDHPDTQRLRAHLAKTAKLAPSAGPVSAGGNFSMKRPAEPETENAPPETPQYVTLDQAAAMVNRSKDTLSRRKNQRGS